MPAQTIEPGYCRCGCRTWIGFYPRTWGHLGVKKGEPKKFANGHFQEPAIQRFAQRLDLTGPPDDCWLWRGPEWGGGYGRISADGKNHYAHRYAYEELVGPIPEGLELDHLCRNRRCVNPAHLEPVSHAENVRRGLRGEMRERRTHCPQGHPYSGENLYLHPNGARVCRECTRAHQIRYQERKKASQP